MKRVLYFVLLLGAAAVGWLLLTKPVGAQTVGNVRLPPETLPIRVTDSAVLRLSYPAAYPQISEIAHDLVPSAPEEFFKTGEFDLSREIEHLMANPSDISSLLKIDSGVMQLPSPALDESH